MLFILVRSLDEVRWQCGVYGHHIATTIKEGKTPHPVTLPRCEFTSQLCVADVTALCFGTRRSVR